MMMNGFAQAPQSPQARPTRVQPFAPSDRQRWTCSTFRVFPQHARGMIQELGCCTVVIGPHAFPNVAWFAAPVGVLVFEFPENKGVLWCALPWELEFERMVGGDDLQGKYTPLPDFADPPFVDPASAADLSRRGPQRLFVLHAPHRLQQFLRAADPGRVSGTPPRGAAAIQQQQQQQQQQTTSQKWYSGMCEFWVEGQQVCHSQPTAESPIVAPTQPWQSPAFNRIVAPSPQRAEASPLLLASLPPTTPLIGATQPSPLPSMSLPPMQLQPLQARASAFQHHAQGIQQAIHLQRLTDGMDCLAEAARSIDRALFSPPPMEEAPAVAPAVPVPSAPVAPQEDEEAVARLLQGVSQKHTSLPSMFEIPGLAVPVPAPQMMPPQPPMMAQMPQQMQDSPHMKRHYSDGEEEYTGASDETEESGSDADADDYAPNALGSPSKRKRLSQSMPLGRKKRGSGKTGTRTDTPVAPICRWKGCGRVFERVSQLTSHLQTHTMSQSVHRCQWEGCSRTGKPFGNHSGLFRHLRYHTGDKPCKCTYGSCTFSSVDNGELRRHLKLVHRVEMADTTSPAVRACCSTSAANDRLSPPHPNIPMLSLAPQTPQPLGHLALSSVMP